MPVDKSMWTERARTLAFGLAVVAALLFGPLLVARPAHAATFTVNSAADPGTGGCDATECTLREAITAANANDNEPTVDLINFAIPGAGPHTISPASDLPAIAEAVTINGYSESLDEGTTPASPNTLAVGNNAVLKIVLDGTNAFNGLRIQAANSTVKGLVINRFDNVSLWLQSGATGNKVEGNYIGTDAPGTADLGNLYGVYIEGSNNTVGGTGAAARNIISGNDIGVFIALSGATGNQVMGNYIGTKASGTEALGNNLGVIINGASSNTVGGTEAGARNVISGNIPSPPLGLSGDGVYITVPGTTNNKVEGNYIGTDASGTQPLGNAQGVRIDNQASNNTVGGTEAGARNVISANSGDGVVIGDVPDADATGNKVMGNYIGTDASGTQPLGNTGNGVVIRGSSSTGNPILSNSIFANEELGIDLVGGAENTFGVTANDNKDPDKGANMLQNFPVLSSATSSGGQTTIQARLNSTPSRTFTIQFFSSPEKDPSRFGEGKEFVGQRRVTTSSEGIRSFTFTVKQGLQQGTFVTATATRLVPSPNDPTTLLPRNTSEFSAAREVT